MVECNFCEKTTDDVDMMYQSHDGSACVCSQCIVRTSKHLAEWYQTKNHTLCKEVSANKYLHNKLETNEIKILKDELIRRDNFFCPYSKGSIFDSPDPWQQKEK